MSSKIKLKVCGITEQQNRADIIPLAPDFIGYIFYGDSKRFVTRATAQSFRPPLDADLVTRAIGVFVNEAAEEVVTTAHALALWGVQLHGDEDRHYCEQLKRMLPTTAVIKVIPIADREGFAVRDNFVSAVDYFLYETKTPLRGGSGESFDWSLLQLVSHEKPFFISGGIGPENIEAVMTVCKELPLYAIDINSKVETLPGIKSTRLIHEVMDKLS